MRWALSLLLPVVLMACSGGNGGDVGTEDPQPGEEPCEEPLPVTVQAEDAELTDVEVASDVGGYLGSGYVADFANVGDQVTFDVCVPEGGYYTLEFRYAKGTPDITTRTIVVDGVPFAAPPQFLPQGSWSQWVEGGRRALYLEEGQHEIALAFTPADVGQLRLDAMTVSAGPSPSEVSVRSVLMNDWDDVVAIWQAAQLYPADDDEFGPRLAAIHSRIDWPTNQIDEAQAFLRDNTGGVAYDDVSQIETRNYFTASDEEGYGELYSEYGPYVGQPLPVDLVRRQIIPPNDDVILVIYELHNVSDEVREVALLEWVDLHNKTTGPSEDPGDTGEVTPPDGTLSAEWYAEANAWIADMTETNGTALVLGAFEPVDHHMAGAPVSGGPDADAPRVQEFFNEPSLLADDESFEGTDVGVGLQKTIRVEPGARQEVAFFYAVTDSVDAARALAEEIQSGRSPDEIAQASSQAWRDWLTSGQVGSLEPPVDAWAEAFEVAMLTIRQSQQPEFGTFVAATNPAYFYSVWPRDAAVTAIGLDAAGYHDAAENYWRWMAGAQVTEAGQDIPVDVGAWWTNYGYWSEDRPVPFVDPEYDSVGLFLVGVYHHYQLLSEREPERASAFLDDMWPTVELAANFVQEGANNPENHGFGPPDYSIWEEYLAYHTFTQATYVAGLRAAELLAEARGEDRAGWGQAADTIRQAIFRPVSAEPCPGLWEDDLSFFIRSVSLECEPNRQIDASTDILWVLGVLSPDSPRVPPHRDAVLFNLTPSEDWGFGISRYEGDTFYYTAPASPGGPFEALEPMPTWPQMTMYMAMLEHWLGMEDISSNRLSWYGATAPRGFMPHGEAVDWSTQRPLISTASEPVTGAWFSLGLLNQLDLFDPRVPPREGWGVEDDGS